MNEIWKTIEEFDNYEISNLGRVRNITTGKVLKPVLDNRGYYKVFLYNNKAYTRFIHRLVAENFIPNPDNYPCVNHIDEVKKNNSISNLEWCSYQYNINYGTRNERVSRSMLGNKNGLGNKSKSKRVMCIQTGETFKSARDAERKYGLTPASVRSSANPNRNQKTAGGYTWCYV